MLIIIEIFLPKTMRGGALGTEHSKMRDIILLLVREKEKRLQLRVYTKGSKSNLI